MNEGATQEGFPQNAVLKAVKITYRQLDYWARTGLVTPSIASAKGSGTKRLYSFRDILELRVIKKLLDAGVSLQKIRKALTYLREDLRQPLGEVTLVSDGRTIQACVSADEVIDLLQSGQGVFAIAMGPVQAELEGTIEPLRQRSSTAATEEDDHRSEASV